jgi:MFS family permease
MSKSTAVLSRTFRAFRYRDFRLMWIGACASTIGTFVQQFAQSWLVYDLTRDPFYLGLDLFLGQLPIIMFSLFGGVFADRLDRRKMLLASQYIQMVCAFLLAALFALHVVKVWHILTLSFVVGLGQSFGGPAYSSLLPTLVGPEDLSNAIAMNSIQFNLARILGPTIGGLAYATLGATWCFTLNGVSYLAVIASLFMIHVKFVPVKSKESVLASMKEGIRFIRRRDGMSALVILAFCTTLFGFSLNGFLPVFVRNVFHKGPETYTLLLVCSGAGSICGALIVASLEKAVC